MFDMDGLEQACADVYAVAKDWGHGLPERAAPLGVLVGVALLALVALQATWAIVRLIFLPQAARGAVQVVAGALARAVRDGAATSAALLSMQSRLRWPYPFRLRACARVLESGQATSLVRAAVEYRVLPEACQGTGIAAEAVGPAALAGWLAGLAERRQSTDWTRTGAFSISIVIAMVLIARAIAALIVPKWEAIMRDLGIPEPARFHALVSVVGFIDAWWWLVLLVALPMVVMSLALASRWHWRRRQRQDRARVILAGIACGRAEAALAHDLQPALPTSQALAEAARSGDFTLLCRACGWIATTPAALTAAVESDRWRQARVESAWRVARTVLVPLALAGAVFWICTALFGVLIDLIAVLAEQST